MWEAVERNRKRENEETNKIEKHCKIVILPDRLHETIDRRVKYRARYVCKLFLSPFSFEFHNFFVILIIFSGMDHKKEKWYPYASKRCM